MRDIKWVQYTKERIKQTDENAYIPINDAERRLPYM